MDFSRFIKTLDEQKAAFDTVAYEMDAKGYDDICNKLNSTLSDISLVASVVPIESKKDLIDILKSIRVLAVDLQELRKKFDGPEEVVTNKQPTVVEEQAPVEQVPPVDNTSNRNEPSQSEIQTLEKGNAKSLTLVNPSVPNGNVFSQFNQAA